MGFRLSALGLGLGRLSGLQVQACVVEEEWRLRVSGFLRQTCQELLSKGRDWKQFEMAVKDHAGHKPLELLGT